MATDKTVKEQFGWLPTSVFKPQRSPDWDKVIGDEGDIATRRSGDAKYLPNLRYSKFHPHLAELVIRYWSQVGELVVDPFAGRATRGVVAATLGREYQGYDVAAETVENSRRRLRPLGASIIEDDGCLMNATTTGTADLVFTCPPYHRLERYQSALGQLSDIADYSVFLDRISDAANSIMRVLRSGRFCCWVCADWRDGKAFRLFHKDSLDIFAEVGMVPWDIVIIHNNSPFAPLQAGKVAAKRYTSKVHEYLLVFRKPE